MKNYRVQVETNDGCVTVWYEQSRAKTADKLILNRVYNQLCGLNIKEINVTPSVWLMTNTPNDNIIDRDTLQDAMIQQILDDMDIKTMMAILYDNMQESYDKYSIDELISEVEEYYPHLLEEAQCA